MVDKCSTVLTWFNCTVYLPDPSTNQPGSMVVATVQRLGDFRPVDATGSDLTRGGL